MATKKTKSNTEKESKAKESKTKENKAKSSKKGKEKKKVSSARQSNFLKVFTNEYLVVKNAVALGLLVLAFFVIFPVMIKASLVTKIILLFAGAVVLGLAMLLIVEYISKVAKIQSSKVSRYSLFVSMNTIFGLALPLIFTNMVSKHLIYLLKTFPKNDGWFCELRYDVMGFYLKNNVSHAISELTFAIVVIAVALFVFGGLYERSQRA
jgi:hypothetical protein